MSKLLNQALGVSIAASRTCTVRRSTGQAKELGAAGTKVGEYSLSFLNKQTSGHSVCLAILLGLLLGKRELLYSFLYFAAMHKWSSRSLPSLL